MSYILATNITSPLGMTTAENYRAVKAGRSALRRYEGLWGLPEPFTASLFTDEQQRIMATDGCTRFESVVEHSVREALGQIPAVDIGAQDVVFILSTTKANVELLSSHTCDGQQGQADATPTAEAPIYPGEVARHIAAHLGFSNEPVVVCNACISGVTAIILAQRLLSSGKYDYAVVCGADVQNRFTISGFQSLKAVATDDCRPFDMERMGLNLGEAAATIVLSRNEHRGHTGFCVERGAVRNDAYHVSSPSKDGEGARLALTATTEGVPVDRIAFINAHGTATMFNDQMESVAIERAGLNSIPVNGLKGCYGHTLGAAGILETVVSLAALRDDTILATRGFEERGVSGRICVTTGNIPIARSDSGTTRSGFIKMISGFGGGNAAIMVTATGNGGMQEPGRHTGRLTMAHRVTISPTTVSIDGQYLPTPSGQDSRNILTALYKEYVGDYPKYYKMDGLSRLGFIASELLLQAERKDMAAAEGSTAHHTDRAIVLFNHSSSVDADRKYLDTIAEDDFFPSPSIFVYTLPNIVTGEIAMRNAYHGETSFYVLPERNDRLMRQVIEATFQDDAVKSIITGWLDYQDDSHFVADLTIVGNLLP